MNGFGINGALRFPRSIQKPKVRKLRLGLSRKMQKPKNAKDKLAAEVVATLDYLLQEGFICLTDQKEPTIVLSQEANI